MSVPILAKPLLQLYIFSHSQHNLFFLQLSSIPELNTPTPTTTTEVQKTEAAPAPEALTESVNTNPATADPQPQPEEQALNVDTVEGKVARPEYDRFVKMVQVGVPLQAVKLKLSLEGLEPNILDEILGNK